MKATPGGGTRTRSTSVYHRARLLSPLFPWLLFSPASCRPALSPALGRNLNDNENGDAFVSDPPPSVLRGHESSLRDSRYQRRRKLPKTVQNYCGATWTDANNSCKRPCPDGESNACDWGEECFADLTSCPSMTLLSPQESGLPPPQPPGLAWGANAGGSWGGSDASHANAGGGGGGGRGGDGSSSSEYGSLPFQYGVVIPPSCPSTTNTVNVGYYQSWAKYRSADCHPQTASQIPVKEFGYTHLIYSFAGISLRGELEPYNGIMEETTLYREFNNLKYSHGNEGLKTLVAVGGWNLDQTLFARAAATAQSRRAFAESAVRFLQRHGFDGLDLDWEYPVTRQGSAADYGNYPLLVEAIRRAFDDAGRGYLLTMAVPVNPSKLDEGYRLRALSDNVDWFHLMSYDVHGSWDDVAGSNTDLEYITDAVENHILNRGVGAEQLVFGMAAYGRSMRLTQEGCVTAGCPIDGAGIEGCSGELGFSPYFELKEKYVDTGQYESLLMNKRAGSMEMVLEGGVFVSLDVEDTFEMKREYYLSK